MMFYCAECAKKNNWPGSARKSWGPCEVCKRTASCYDVPSASLPLPGEQSDKRWWHVYAGHGDDAAWGDDIHTTLIIGNCPTPPEEMRRVLRIMPDLKYVGSLDHDPVEVEHFNG